MPNRRRWTENGSKNLSPCRFYASDGRSTEPFLRLRKRKLIGVVSHERCMPPHLQTWITKHSVGICLVGKFMTIWQLESTDECPLCGLPEDHLHVPRCADPRVQEEWDHQMKGFSSWLALNATGG